MKKALLLALPLLLAACGGFENIPGSDYSGDDMTEESLNGSVTNDYSESRVTEESKDLLYAGPKYYVGTPYKIEDTQYAPGEDYMYNQTGTAGIVPVDLNGVSTTNGETFDTEAMVATSKTLPLPSIVRVTNAENGKSAVLRVNNRGPFVNSRLLDVSPAAARKLGMTGQTKVRAEILAEESKKVKELTEAKSMTTLPAATTGPLTTAATGAGTGPYTVQVGAYYAEDSANSIASRVSGIGNAVVVEEGGMYKIRIQGLSAEDARGVIDRLRNEENMAPGLLKDGRWVNADGI